MKSAIVAGATGMIGRSVAQYLSSNGIYTIALGRNLSGISPAGLSSNKLLSYIEISMFELSKLQNYIEEKIWSIEDCVFYNFAWKGNRTISDGTLNDQMQNVIFSANAIKVAKDIGCTKFINCGSLQETFTELVIAKNLSIKNLNQKNYSIAKIAARDMSLIEAYCNKIDYIHTRVSVPLSLDFNNNSYIHLSLKNILNGVQYDEPQSPEIFDFIRLEELAHAYLLLGEKGVNKVDYYIGSKTPSTLRTYFANFREFVNSKTQNPYDRLGKFHCDIFDTSRIENDTGFVPSESFNLFMNEAIIKWLK